MKPAREPTSSCPKPCASLKKPTNLARSPLFVGPRRQKTDRGQRSYFPLETSRFVPCILVSRRGFSHPIPRRPAHLPLPERIWCSLTGSSPPSCFPRRYCTVLYCTPVFVPRPLVRTVWLVDSTGSAPPTTSDMPLAGYSTPGLLTVIVSSLPRFGSTPAGRQPGQGRA